MVVPAFAVHGCLFLGDVERVVDNGRLVHSVFLKTCCSFLEADRFSSAEAFPKNSDVDH